VLLKERADFGFARCGDTKEIFGEATRVRIGFFARLPEGLADFVGSLPAYIGLEKHLHGEFPGFAAFADERHARDSDDS
jgi:hypothetical protein